MRRVLLSLIVLALVGCGESAPPSDGDRDAEVVEQIEDQLEENQQDLPQDVPSEAPVRPRSLKQFVRDYQRAGFFEDEDPARAAGRIARAFEREWGEPARVRTRLDELTLLAYDRDRAWYSDIERDVLPGNDEYVSVLKEWSRISAGAFRPRRIHELWRGEEGPVDISFELDGRRHQVRAAPQADFLDLCVLPAINELIGGRRFELYRPDPALGQSAFVVALTRAERRRLEGRGRTSSAWRSPTGSCTKRALASAAEVGRRRDDRSFGRGPYLLGLRRTEDWGAGFPFDVPAVERIEDLRLDAAVTLIAGDNGTGKSTVVEAVAEAIGFGEEGGELERSGELPAVAGPAMHRGVAPTLTSTKPRKGYFLRAESFFNVAAFVDSGGIHAPDLSLYGDVPLHQQSHGQAFLALAANRFGGEGFYVLDEPEAALSLSGALALIAVIVRAAEAGAQFVIATHSPILLATPGARIYEFDESGFAERAYDDVDAVRMMRAFLDAPERFIHAALGRE